MFCWMVSILFIPFILAKNEKKSSGQDEGDSGEKDCQQSINPMAMSPLIWEPSAMNSPA